MHTLDVELLGEFSYGCRTMHSCANSMSCLSSKIKTQSVSPLLVSLPVQVRLIAGRDV